MMEDWADHISELYEQYMADHCTCASSDEECTCMGFEEFSDSYVEELREAWGTQIVEFHKDAVERQGYLECHF